MKRTLLTTDLGRMREASSIPTATYSEKTRAWYFDADDPSSVKVALSLFPDVKDRVDAPDPTGIARPVDYATPFRREREVEELLPYVPDRIRQVLYPYQATDVAYAAALVTHEKGAYLGWSRGLGKTLGAITTAIQLRADHIIVVAPNSAKDAVWGQEFAKWAPEYEVFNVGGTKKKRDVAFAQFYGSPKGVLLIHYEALRLMPWDQVRPVDLVVCDEAHRLANGGPSQGRGVPQFYKALKRIPTHGKLALSGSLIVNSPEDLFGALHWLYPTRYKSRWRDWNDRFLHYLEGPWGRVLVGLKEEKLPELRDELGKSTCVRHKEDELDGLPDRIEETLYVDLSPEQRKVYNELATNFIAELPSGEQLLAVNVLSQLTKLRQVATGLDLMDGTVSDSTKLDLAVELVSDNLPHKTVVFTWHKAAARALAERLEANGVRTAVVDGDVPAKKRGELIAEFQEKPTITCFIGTMKTLGESVTLTAAADVVFLEQPWTPADREQAADRVYRIGQKRRVTVTHIIARDTVDMTRVLPRLATKQALRDLVLGR